ncbi:sigma-54-dependent Fis family transcriptional regulator [Aliikangiella coralliicola]|uniref:Sigma-54-dependent Fis family transcriptional regulator n=1 Tax=Aliikangiella coralliicola TaxID=2592383 RepID=A0A545U815_9GAMM|nr:sigma-54-dependent Fis family transcriptional regulator [Aliikangiella coralliicola]
MNQEPLILVVDDDRSVTASLALLLKQNNFKAIQAHSPATALESLKNHRISLVLQDMNFSRSTSGEEGLELLGQIRISYPHIPVILMTAWASISLAVEGMRCGASDFISKPWDNQYLLRTVTTAIGLASPKEDELLSREQLDDQFNFTHIVGESPALLKTLNTIGRVCKTDASILILGESGTGKEMMADAIHQNSLRNRSPLVKVNLGGINPSLFESEMFGHVKGAFTDAKHDREGRFSAANGGTLFLDEIGELEKSSQVKLLRVLQDQNFQMVGSSKNTSVNVRVVSATNRNLEEMVEEGSFREDLFYRINLIAFELPPLRNRTSDIPLLAQSHLRKISKLYGMSEAKISPKALTWLQQQQWPGNIRQLCQTIERVLLMSGKNELEYLDFIPRDAVEQENKLSDFEVGSLTLEQMEKIMIEKSLAAYQGNISKVADALGLSRAALYRRMDKHGLNS